jgi:mono/diheme cytochrome c family protein
MSMLRFLRYSSALSLLVVTSACASGAPSAEPAPAAAAPAPAAEEAEPTTADGIYTLAQADRGRDLFRSTCSECHDVDDWTDTGFRGRWEDESVFQLWYYINDRMPYDDPWSLSRQQVTDVLTYILQLNELPAGDTELATDDDSIDDFWIAWSAAK